MKLYRFSLIVAFTAAISIASIQSAQARPHPDRAGVCYFFRGETRELTQTCIIGGGYGAGGHYAILQWPDGVQTNITMINYCPNGGYGEDGFCRYTVDDSEATRYQRDVFLETTTFSESDNLNCYRVIETGNSVCFRVNR